MTAILAIDLGTNLGWAMRLADGATISGGENFSPGRFQGGGMRFVRFRRWLDEIPTPTAAYFEEVRRHTGTDAAHIYGGLLAHLTQWCESKGIPYQGVPVATIKKHATGKGSASKEAMIAAAQALGFRPGSHDEADALAILSWACKEAGLPAIGGPHGPK